jgi:hypothetical protein
MSKSVSTALRQLFGKNASDLEKFPDLFLGQI